MEAKKIKIGEKIYYLDLYRDQVHVGTVSRFRHTVNNRVQKVLVEDNYYGSPQPHQVLGPVVPLEEGDG